MTKPHSKHGALRPSSRVGFACVFTVMVACQARVPAPKLDGACSTEGALACGIGTPGMTAVLSCANGTWTIFEDCGGQFSCAGPAGGPPACAKLGTGDAISDAKKDTDPCAHNTVPGSCQEYYFDPSRPSLSGPCATRAKAAGTQCDASNVGDGPCGFATGLCDGERKCIRDPAPFGSACSGAETECVKSSGTCSSFGTCFLDPKPAGMPCNANSTFCPAGPGLCDGAGHCNTVPLGQGASCYGACYGPCIADKGSCDADHACKPVLLPAGTACEPAPHTCQQTAIDQKEIGICNEKGRCIAPMAAAVGTPCRELGCGTCLAGGVCGFGLPAPGTVTQLASEGTVTIAVFVPGAATFGCATGDCKVATCPTGQVPWQVTAGGIFAEKDWVSRIGRAELVAQDNLRFVAGSVALTDSRQCGLDAEPPQAWTLDANGVVQPAAVLAPTTAEPPSMTDFRSYAAVLLRSGEVVSLRRESPNILHPEQFPNDATWLVPWLAAPGQAGFAHKPAYRYGEHGGHLDNPRSASDGSLLMGFATMYYGIASQQLLDIEVLRPTGEWAKVLGPLTSFDGFSPVFDYNAGRVAMIAKSLVGACYSEVLLAKKPLSHYPLGDLTPIRVDGTGEQTQILAHADGSALLVTQGGAPAGQSVLSLIRISNKADIGRTNLVFPLELARWRVELLPAKQHLLVAEPKVAEGDARWLWLAWLDKDGKLLRERTAVAPGGGGNPDAYVGPQGSIAIRWREIGKQRAVFQRLDAMGEMVCKPAGAPCPACGSAEPCFVGSCVAGACEYVAKPDGGSCIAPQSGSPGTCSGKHGLCRTCAGLTAQGVCAASTDGQPHVCTPGAFQCCRP